MSFRWQALICPGAISRSGGASRRQTTDVRVDALLDVAQLSDTEVDSMLRSLLAEQRSG